MFSSTPATLALIVVIAGVSFIALANRKLFAALLLSSWSVVHEHQYYRLVSSGIIHADYGHLIFNCITIFFFGSLLEEVIGSVLFTALFVGGVIAGSVYGVWRNRDNPQYAALGASGGACAVIGSVTFLIPNLPMIFLMFPIPIPAWLFGTLFLLYSVVGMRRGTDNIGHDAHLIGTVFGIGATAVIFPDLIELHGLYAVVMILPALLAVLIIRRKQESSKSHGIP